jgi:hypothetical protein
MSHDVEGAERLRQGILIIKPKRYTISQIYFGIELYMFRTGLLPITRSLVLYTQQKVFVMLVMLTVC